MVIAYLSPSLDEVTVVLGINGNLILNYVLLKKSWNGVVITANAVTERYVY